MTKVKRLRQFPLKKKRKIAVSCMISNTDTSKDIIMRNRPFRDFELVINLVTMQEQTTTGRDSRQLAPKQGQEPN